jgi:hypothetical protein
MDPLLMGLESMLGEHGPLGAHVHVNGVSQL